MEAGVSHEIMMQKVVSTNGLELSAEKRIPMTLAWVGDSAQADTSTALAGEIIPEPSETPIDLPADTIPSPLEPEVADTTFD